MCHRILSIQPHVLENADVALEFEPTIMQISLCPWFIGILTGERGEGRKHGEGVYHGLDYTLMGILLPSFHLLPAVKWWMCTVRFSIFIPSFTRVFTNLDFLHLTLIDRFTLMDDGIITRNTWKLSFVVGISELRMESNLIIRYFDKKYIW